MQEHNDTHPPSGTGKVGSGASEFEIRQTATGYWTVQREGRHVTGAMTRSAAEAERDLMLRLRSRTVRRSVVGQP
jgi:hypothetical protein